MAVCPGGTFPTRSIYGKRFLLRAVIKTISITTSLSLCGFCIRFPNKRHLFLTPRRHMKHAVSTISSSPPSHHITPIYSDHDSVTRINGQYQAFPSYQTSYTSNLHQSALADRAVIRNNRWLETKRQPCQAIPTAT